jgi:hypothetical protein
MMLSQINVLNLRSGERGANVDYIPTPPEFSVEIYLNRPGNRSSRPVLLGKSV